MHSLSEWRRRALTKTERVRSRSVAGRHATPPASLVLFIGWLFPPESCPGQVTSFTWPAPLPAAPRLSRLPSARNTTPPRTARKRLSGHTRGIGEADRSARGRFECWRSNNKWRLKTTGIQDLSFRNAYWLGVLRKNDEGPTEKMHRVARVARSEVLRRAWCPGMLSTPFGVPQSVPPVSVSPKPS
jgi:hypothetical protein